MALYTFHELSLEVTHEGQRSHATLDQLLHDLSWRRTGARGLTPSLRVAVHRHHGAPDVPPTAHEVFWADGFAGLAHGPDFYVTDRASLWQLVPLQGYGAVYLA